jgi:hypothetical protein
VYYIFEQQISVLVDLDLFLEAQKIDLNLLTNPQTVKHSLRNTCIYKRKFSKKIVENIENKWEIFFLEIG